ncbi:Por secretion system C-terminal sorting domain-containing protein [Arachidicoccus rhizosphaerae]|uniref:Por secretion system C-terminal sorting domain-containing protein n=1 Tax=Arachidicoccus rhizosphaerae TaxID=551991 RepID=A0A1H3Y3U6_9BACT|nr:T9SS type A sorting domain-containing protein [Arachidicoccus rhizosphaerae]SEA06309.1 Por secretion system C-terminal sorting domain-containing protein [Arachidicoccus rhizosphaerae]
MKTFLLRNPKRILALASLAGVCGLIGTASAQTHLVREYANFQSTDATLLLASVTNPENAIDGNTQTYSTLDLTAEVLGLTHSTQYLGFSTDGTRDNLETISAGKTIYIKFSTSSDLVSALGNIEIGTFTMAPTGFLGAWVTTPTSVYTSTNLVTLLNGSGTNELAIVAPSNCNGVYIKLSAAVSLLSTTDLFHAYVLNSEAGNAGCPTNIDYLSGVEAASGVALANVTSTVADEANAFDNDDNTAATLSTGVNALSEAYLTDILSTPGKAGDSVRVVFNNPSGGVLNLDLLSGFTIQAYNGTTAVGDPVAVNSSLINLALLPGSTTKTIITAPVQGTSAGDFDRIKITYGGIAQTSSLLGNGTLAIYSMGVLVPAPQTNNVAHSTIYTYVGKSVTLTAAQNANNDAILWYDNPNGTGSTVSTTQTGLTAGTHNFYARSSRDGCTEGSANDTITVNVASILHNSLTNAAVGSPYTGKLDITVETDPNLPFTPVYKLSNIVGTLDDGTTINLSGIKSFNNIAMANIPAMYGSGPMSSLNANLFAADPLDGGLQMDEDGNISGTPTQEGTLHITATVTDVANSLDAGPIATDLVIGQALPVTLTNFDVKLDDNKNAVLSWTTESEQGSIRFDILRSNDGSNFATIGSVDAAGVSTHTKNYSFTDQNPGAKSYYKLSIVKADGIETSKTVSIAGGKVAGFSITPNPASNNLTITGISNIKSVSIYDASGRLVQTATNSSISVRNLSAGIYYVTVITTDGNKTNGKFIKK